MSSISKETQETDANIMVNRGTKENLEDKSMASSGAGAAKTIKSSKSLVQRAKSVGTAVVKQTTDCFGRTAALLSLSSKNKAQKKQRKTEHQAHNLKSKSIFVHTGQNLNAIRKKLKEEGLWENTYQADKTEKRKCNGCGEKKTVNHFMAYSWNNVAGYPK